MSRFEGQLITRIVDTGDLRAAGGLTSEMLFRPETRAAWSYLQEYNLRHGAVPSREMLEASVPGFHFEPALDPVTALVERVEEFYAYNLLNSTMEHVAQLATTDVNAAVAYIADQAMRMRTLSVKRDRGVDLTQVVQSEIDEYYRRKNLKGLLGLSWPWPRMNRATFGIMAGQLIMFYARPKNMKTWVLLFLIEWLHYMHKKRPVMFTREMSVPELRRRYCALWAGIDYDHYLRGCLSNADEIRWREAMEAFMEAPPIVIETVPSSGAEAADEMVSKVQELGADFMAVDGVYFFGNREWEQIAAFTSRLKYHLLNTLNIPCIATTQGSRQFSHGKKGKNNADDVGYSDAILQDVDVLIKCALVREDQRIYLSLPAIREGQDCEFQINALPAYNFKQAFAEEGHEAEIGQAESIEEEELIHAE